MKELIIRIMCLRVWSCVTEWMNLRAISLTSSNWLYLLSLLIDVELACDGREFFLRVAAREVTVLVL